MVRLLGSNWALAAVLERVGATAGATRMSTSVLRIVRSYVERFPSLACTYRVLRDSWAFQRHDPRPTSYGFRLGGNALMETGTFEPEQTAVIRHRLETADVFVDVGANIGLYTCLARAANKHVLAVEPLPQNLAYLYANLEANAWRAGVEVFPLGLAREPGLATMYGSNTGASLVRGWSGASRIHERTVPVSTLDTLVGRRFEGRRLLIKVDVEGMEYDLLLGAETTLMLSPPPVWMVEITLAEHHPAGLNPNYVATFQVFWRLGYEAWTATADSRRVERQDVERWQRLGRCQLGIHDFLFIHGRANSSPR